MTGPDAAGWLPIDDRARNGEPWLVHGYGIHHGVPFVAQYQPSHHLPHEPWVKVIGGGRFYDHCLTHYQPVPVLPAAPEGEG